MNRIDFYHLQNMTLEEALPKLLEKAYATGNKIVVKVGNAERIDFLNSLLWTYSDTSFLPHGSKKDGFAELQPIWLTDGEDIPNNAKFLFLVDGAEIENQKISDFERIFIIFDGNNEESLQQARRLWKSFKQCSNNVFYWQKDDNGSWKQRG